MEMMEYERYLERGYFVNETSKRCFGLIKGSGKIIRMLVAALVMFLSLAGWGDVAVNLVDGNDGV